MDCYFRQSWKDFRLAYDPEMYLGKPKNLALSVSMLDKIWKPDTYFYNGKKAYIHTITNPNKFVRIASDGMVLYSSRYVDVFTCLFDPIVSEGIILFAFCGKTFELPQVNWHI